MRTIRRDAIHEAQPAQRRLRGWRDRRAPVPCVLPSAASPDGKTEVMFKPRSGESVQTGRLGTPAVPGQTRSARAQARSPRALETIGIHLNIALGLSNEVGPPQRREVQLTDPFTHMAPDHVFDHSAVGEDRLEEGVEHGASGIGGAPISPESVGGRMAGWDGFTE